MSLPNKKLIYAVVAPFAPALVPFLLAAIWTTAGLIAQSVSTDNDSQVAEQEQELLLAQNKPSQVDPEISTKIEKPRQKIAIVAAVPKTTPSPNVTINLINRLVQRGVLTQSDADELIKQAENDAATARDMAAKESARAARDQTVAPPPFPFAEPSPLPNTASANVAVEPPPPATGTESNGEEDSVSVSYVPDVVKEQLREEIKQEVMETAREENWANPRIFPSWVLAFHPFADIRLRYEGVFFPPGSDHDADREEKHGITFQFVNFNAINTGAPFDVTNGVNFEPLLNTDEDRQRARIRARFGAQMDLDEGFSLGVRVATGETNTPTSTNQTLGVANNGQGGNYSKYAIWLDRAFVKYELGGKPTEDFVAEIGRFDNPFFTVSELMWDVDLGWDGLAVSGKYNVADGVTPFATTGIFPVFNTDLNFSSNQPDKFVSEDKFLYGGQAGVSLRLTKDFSTKIAGGFFDFYNVEGKISDPCIVLSSADQCDTDDSRPSFAQHGNTYFPIRHILRTFDNNNGLSKQFEYFGLATPFRVATFTGNLDFARFDPVHLTVFGEWINNVAFDYDDVNHVALNNIGPNRPPPGPTPSPSATPRPGLFAGGNSGWIAGLKAGHAALEKRWDWTVGGDYRYVESDATVDAFNDSDFGGGGTNLKGYEIFGGLAVSRNVSFYLRWMSADSIAGPKFRNDIVQFDFNAKF